MPFTRFKVVEVVRRSDFDGTGAELAVDEDRIAHDRNRAVCEGETNSLTDQSIVTGIFRVDRHRTIAEHGFRSGRRDREPDRWILFEWIVDRVQFSFDIFVFNLDVRQSREATRAPVDQPLTSINQPIFMEPY